MINDVRSSRAPFVLGFILFVLIAAAIAFPRFVDATTSASETNTPSNPVELGNVSLPDGNGGTLECSNPSGFGGDTSIWDCGETRILGRSARTPDDPTMALARYYRAAALERTVDTDGVESPRSGVHVKANGESGADALVAVSVADGETTRYFSFGGDKAGELSLRLIDGAAVATSEKEASE
ncbi:hypothetical protein QYQ98_00305 [Corynebacterium sp. P3-F1]|uniref:hypothetical protein n=1 Tax=Corynebacterium sp. P3-F1 TaxID=3059080 RepID=UPI00265CEAB6|nr:hypothetical protein [Corynebacterium sp. P3-F1]WKK61393.1 hypothetical protein QYQ98_00305 [Corynebacterium sp. P3-F1]